MQEMWGRAAAKGVLAQKIGAGWRSFVCHGHRGTGYHRNMTDRMSLSLAQADPEVAAAIDHETLRQHEGLEMIASENFVSEAVLEAAGSVFTNKYAEGYPGRRYYGGCEYTDVVENLARDRAKQIFGAEHANVQAHSGSQANASAYMAVLQAGDTILGLDLAHGGHLTHGHKLSFSGKLYKTALAGFVISFLVLGYMGTLEPTLWYVNPISRICALIYFGFFVLMPVYSKLDKTKPVPDRVTS